MSLLGLGHVLVKFQLHQGFFSSFLCNIYHITLMLLQTKSFDRAMGVSKFKETTTKDGMELFRILVSHLWAPFFLSKLVILPFSYNIGLSNSWSDGS